MDGVGRSRWAIVARAHQLRRRPAVGTFSSARRRAAFSVGEQFSNAPLRIGERHGHGMPAVENDRIVRARTAVAPSRAGGGAPPFAASALEWRLSIAIVHGQACVTGSRQWQFGVYRPYLADCVG